MKPFYLTLLSLTLALAARAGHEEEPRSHADLSLRDVVRAVLAQNASIKAARAKWEMIKARVPQARAWDDPMIGADVERMGSTRFTSYSDVEYMVSQTIPLTGKNLSRA